MRFEFSAGGVVYRKDAGRISILVCQHSQHHGWVFPKGLIDEKQLASRRSGSATSLQQSVRETKVEAALREVKEETGINGKIIKSLLPITYWYNLKGEKIKKTVYYFLMEYNGGDITKHDREMENVEWLPMDEVKNRLTYDSDKKVWGQARKMIKSI